MLRPEDHQRGIRGHARQEQPPRAGAKHPLHRLGLLVHGAGAGLHHGVRLHQAEQARATGQISIRAL